jgi:DnaJ-class molecular chaperone
MKKFRTGNVVKLSSGSIVIITENSKTFKGEDCVMWVSFDAANCSGITNIEPFMRGETCFCCEGNGGEYDEECEDCKGSGSYLIRHSGMEGAALLGSTVKAYILKSLTKNFNF